MILSIYISIIFAVIIVIIAYFVIDNTCVTSTKLESGFLALIAGIICGIVMESTLISEINKKGNVTVVSMEKIADIEDAESIIKNGYYYEIIDNKIVKHDISNKEIYIDNSIDGVYLKTQYCSVWKIKVKSNTEIIVIPDSVELNILSK